jgi:hypothetical protein
VHRNSSSCTEAGFKVQFQFRNVEPIAKVSSSSYFKFSTYIFIFSTCAVAQRPISQWNTILKDMWTIWFLVWKIWSGYKMPMANLPFQISTESSGWIKGDKPFYSIVLVRRSWWKSFLELGVWFLAMCIHIQQKSFLEHPKAQ